MRNPNRETKSEWMTPEGILFPQYCNVRYTRNGEISGEYQLELRHAVEDAIESNAGVVGLTKVEWRGSHISDYWSDVTEWFKTHYQEGMTDEA